eukprot:IDg4245t1
MSGRPLYYKWHCTIFEIEKQAYYERGKQGAVFYKSFLHTSLTLFKRNGKQIRPAYSEQRTSANLNLSTVLAADAPPILRRAMIELPLPMTLLVLLTDLRPVFLLHPIKLVLWLVDM